MIKTLTVTARNFKNLTTAVEKEFDTSKMTGIIANPNSSDEPAITGTTHFVYEDDDGITRTFHVSEALADVLDYEDAFVGDVANGTVEEYSEVLHKSEITVTEFTQAVAGAALAFGQKIYDFPEGFVRVLNYVVDLTVSAPTETATPEIGLGTVVGSGANATLGAVGATSEDIADGTAMDAITSAGTAYQAGGAAETDAASLDGSSTAKDLFLNFAATWTATEDVTISGKVTILWAHVGDVDAA